MAKKSKKNSQRAVDMTSKPAMMPTGANFTLTQDKMPALLPESYKKHLSPEEAKNVVFFKPEDGTSKAISGKKKQRSKKTSTNAMESAGVKGKANGPVNIAEPISMSGRLRYFRPQAYHSVVGYGVLEYQEYLKAKAEKCKMKILAINEEQSAFGASPEEANKNMAWQFRRWPCKAMSPTNAPYSYSLDILRNADGDMIPRFTKPAAVQTSATMFEVLQSGTLGPYLLAFIAREGHIATSSLAATCQDATRVVFSFFSNIDVTTCDALANQPREMNMISARLASTSLPNLASTNISAKKPESLGQYVNIVQSRLTSSIMKCLPEDSPLRLQVETDEHVSRLEDHMAIKRMIAKLRPSLCEGAIDKKSQEYVQSLAKLRSMGAGDHVRMSNYGYFDKFFAICADFSSRCQSIRGLNLHALPYVDWRLVTCMVKDMPGLEFLGIYRCHLIDIGDVPQVLHLLGYIKTERKQSIRLDIYPNRHDGPVLPTCKHTVRTGEWGITWDEVGETTHETQTGLAKLITEIAGQAWTLGFPIFERQCALRKWLEDLPIPGEWPAQILDVVYRAFDFGALPKDKQSASERKLLLGQWCALAMPIQKYRWHDWELTAPWIRKIWCCDCLYDMPSWTVSDYLGARRPDQYVCEGCRLKSYMRDQEDHCKGHHNAVIHQLFVPDYPGRGHGEHITSVPPNPLMGRNPEITKSELALDRLRGRFEWVPTLSKICGIFTDHVRYESWLAAQLRAVTTDVELRIEFLEDGAGRRVGYKDPLHWQMPKQETRQWSTCRNLERARRDELYEKELNQYDRDMELFRRGQLRNKPVVPIHEGTWGPALEWKYERPDGELNDPLCPSGLC